MLCSDFLTKWYGLALTNGQRAFVRVAIDRVPVDELEGAELEAARAMFGDLTSAPAVAWRTIVAACGRDSGKTELGAGIGLFLLLTVDTSRCGPGDIPRGFVVAPDLATAKLTIERAVARVLESAELAALLVGEPDAEGFTLRRPSDGRLVRFEVKSASRGGRSLRGRSILFLILDECGLFYGDGYAINDAEIVRAARPRILDGGLVLLLSTPWAEEGLFYDLHAKNANAPQTAIVAHAPTLLMRDNDPALAARIELERQDDPDNAAREYDAQFIAGASSVFFDPASLSNAVREHEPAQFRDRRAGADVGLVRDSSALAIVGKHEDEFALVDIEEWRPTKGNPLKLSAVIAGFAARMRKHEIANVLADGHAREPAREFAAEHRISIIAAPEGRDAKQDLYVATRKLLLEGRLILPNNPRLLAQLRAVRSKPMPGGGYSITSPRRTGMGHGDLVSALVLAVHAAAGPRVRRFVGTERILPF